MTTLARPRVILFDVDGTLVHAGGAGRRALEGIMERELGSAVRRAEKWLAGMKLDGMTDKLIVREAILGAGLQYDEALCDRILAQYVERLAEEIHGPGFRVMPGTAELLASLARSQAFALGLCTGNVRRGAQIKLSRPGFDRYFGFGPDDIQGFAEDGEARERIVEAALRRVSSRLGPSVRPADVLVIGDTPRDISAAHAFGCPVLAVATGRFSVEQLRADGADLAIPTLERHHLPSFLAEG